MKKANFILLFLIGLIACRRNNDCDNTSLHQPTNAAFTIIPQTFNGNDTNWVYFNYDTVPALTAYITFSAEQTEGNPQYEWQIGVETYTTQSVTLYFDGTSSENGSAIPITLTIHRTPDKCFPTDSGIATLTRKMVFSTACHVFGSYQGYYVDSPQHVFTITISKAYNPLGCLYDTVPFLSGFGYIPDTTSTFYNCDGFNLRELYFNAGNSQYSTGYYINDANAILDTTYENIIININYTQVVGAYYSNWIQFKKIFKGTRL